MSETVAVDATTPPGDDSLFLLGVAIEIDDRTKFNEWYFEFVDEFCEANGIETPFRVIKSKTVVDELPSFEIADGMETLATGLLENPYISRINVAIGWYANEVTLAFSGQELSGIEFVKQHLQNYFEILTLWRYHQSHEYGLASEALVDEAQGHITKAWKYVGNEFDLRMVPHGDRTYPPISTADILAYLLGRIMPNDAPFVEYEKPARVWLLKNRNQRTEPYVSVDLVNERYTDHIVPELPYTISEELHYPHPVLFLHDTVLSGNDTQILPETDIHAFARNWAFENDGCVVGFHKNRVPAIVKDGDQIVYTRGSDSEQAEVFDDLHPTKDLRILDSNELVARVSDEL